MPSRKVSPKDRKYIGDDPTAEQLAGMEQRRLEVQGWWTERERERRRYGAVPHWHNAEYTIDVIQYEPSGSAVNITQGVNDATERKEDADG